MLITLAGECLQNHLCETYRETIVKRTAAKAESGWVCYIVAEPGSSVEVISAASCAADGMG
jgi:hypothetical protein